MDGRFPGDYVPSDLPEGRNIYLSLSLDGLLLIAQTTDSLSTLYLIDEALDYNDGLPNQQVDDLRLFLDEKILQFVKRDKRETEIIQEMEDHFK